MAQEEGSALLSEQRDHRESHQTTRLCGNDDSALIWFNTTDLTGLICASIVILFLAYAAICIIYTTMEGTIDLINGVIIAVLIGMSLWCHLKTMMSDAGAVPKNAHPRDRDLPPLICGRCNGFKPPHSHHDKVSNRCISRMDHFCPWMNNAIGAKNQKNFILFLIYTDLAAIYLYILLAIHLIGCNVIGCTQFTGVSLNLVRALIFILLFAIIFTSSMILNQIYGLATGLGTIDRLKLKPEDPETSIPIPFNHVFGDSWITYFLPLDPYFSEPEEVFGYQLKKEDFPSKI